MIDDKQQFEKVLNKLYANHFRIGGGSTKGFGSIDIIEIETKEYDKNSYQTYSSSLNYKLNGEKYTTQNSNSIYTKYKLQIKPEDFFIFGSGFGDSDADSTPVYEKVIKYNTATLSNEQILIPASSIKGAISHRTTYHYNKIKNLYIGNDEAMKSIKEIFGEAKNTKKDIEGSKGKILISDCYKEDNKNTKVFDHVSIDRFTGGAIDGALFQEKTISDNREYTIEILLSKEIQGDELKAFESSLNDICNGMLPLGGMTTKGHGVFGGDLYINGKKELLTKLIKHLIFEREV